MSMSAAGVVKGGCALRARKTHLPATKVAVFHISGSRRAISWWWICWSVGGVVPDGFGFRRSRAWFCDCSSADRILLMNRSPLLLLTMA